uniref:PGG domain-containing protein n=1 Tax=Elaeophora elaphi TaxID=1147741 RepID=A0A0R3RFC3_9BILA
MVPFREHLVFAVAVSVALQEGARLLHFILLKKAQKGLNHMSVAGQRIAGVHTLRHARHVLAIVCGLGMGVMAALFLIINVIADFWGHGTVGLPHFPASFHKQIYHQKITRSPKFVNLQITYSISACMVTLCHVFWTVLFWDGCHKKGTTSSWWVGICFVVISHYAMSALVIILCFVNVFLLLMAVMCVQGVVVVINAVISLLVMGITWPVLKHNTKLAVCRLLCIKDYSSESNGASIPRS